MATAQRRQPSGDSRTAVGKAAGAITTAAASTSRDSVAARAYQIWQESGCPHGLDQQHWFQAERELGARAAKR